MDDARTVTDSEAAAPPATDVAGDSAADTTRSARADSAIAAQGGPDADSIAGDEWAERALGAVTGERKRTYQAVVRRSALNEIHRHGWETDVEVCGVLVGDVHRDESGPYLYISAIVRGDRAEGRTAQVTFTAEAWTHIHTTMDTRYPELRIVGWYHTHPRFGIFLSGMDLFIQENFFNLPWQVALVYDPIGGDEGVFYWRQGRSDREAYLIEEDEPTAIRPAIEEAGDDTIGVGLPTWLVGMIGFLGSFSVTYLIVSGLAPPRMVRLPAPTAHSTVGASAPAVAPVSTSTRGNRAR
jgi:proteasome lid subunit RPN8/RPN11